MISLCRLVRTFTWLLLLANCSTSAVAQCDNDELLVGEDERNWYCSTPDPPDDAAATINAINQHLLGSEWRYRKAVMDTVGSLTRPPGSSYLWGGKIRLESGGQFQWVCVSKTCSGQVSGGIDCSGLVEYGAAHSACFVRGVYSLAGLAVRNIVQNAANQAAYFQSQGAFRYSTDAANPGDFIFFKHTTSESAEDEITHVGIFLGRLQDGTILIIHASSKHGRVLFDRLEPDAKLAQKIAGYGDISILTPGH
jgi:hypothetical protein